MNDWLYTKHVAHRGLHNENFSENTIGAFENAIRHGYNIELDVQPTKDKKLVVYHDIHLRRLTNCDDYVKNITYEQAVNEVVYNDTKQHIPDFSEVLSVCEGRTGLMIEIKKDSYETPELLVEELLVPFLKEYKGDFVVKSFNPYTMKWFADNVPEFTLGFLSEYASIEDYPPHCRSLVNELLFTGKRRVDFFDYCLGKIGSPLWNSVFGKMPCFTWVVRSQKEYDSCRSKVNNIIFENFIPED
jgi:glycerophosphodiester phosphodiesterase